MRFLFVLFLALSSCAYTGVNVRAKYNQYDTPHVVGLTKGFVGGTGFFVSNKYVVTAAHVVQAAKSGTMDIVEYDINKEPRKASVVFLDPINDVAILKDSDPSARKNILRMCNRETRKGDHVRAYGFLLWVIFQSHGVVDWNKMQHISHNADLKTGYSGGPLMRGNCVVGVNKSGRDSHGLFYATDIGVVKSALKSLRSK